MADPDLRWRLVSKHGNPTKETCPYGFRWVAGKESDISGAGLVSDGVGIKLEDSTMWQPLPPPNAAWVPDPVPEDKPSNEWVYGRDFGSIKSLCITRSPVIEDHHEAAFYRDSLQSLEDIGIAVRWRDPKTAEMNRSKRALVAIRGNVVAATEAYAKMMHSPWTPYPDPPIGNQNDTEDS